MRLPNADDALVPSAKLQDYLLSRFHPVGRFKAKFFTALGYRADEWPALERDLRVLLAGEAVETETTIHGQKYEVRGTIVGPSGRSAEVVTVWILRHGENVPRFVTAYPGVRT